MLPIVQTLNGFLDKRIQPGKPILLGISGGPDSSALLHAFWKLQKKYSLNLHAVHIDHGWREESAREADDLRRYFTKLEVPYTIERLKENFQGKNLEEKGRLARIAVFQKIAQELDAQAIALGHHAGDQAETVLKRLLEGSHLVAAGGMRESSDHGGMTLWRPFLHLPKKVLIEYCQQEQIPYIIDRTNRDPRFLRSRMREELLPLLETHFGKAVEKNLSRLSCHAHEIGDYLEGKIGAILEKVKKSKGMVEIDLRGIHQLEAKMVIRKMAQDQGVRLGPQHIDRLAEWLEQGGNPKKFFMSGAVFTVFQGFICIKCNDSEIK